MNRLRPIVLWLLFLLLLPGVAWVLGARQPLIENRPKVEFPPLGSAAALTQGVTFEQIDQAVLDRLPLRRRAVQFNARLNVELFRDSPSPDVAIGDDGWLYYVRELRPCRKHRPIADPAAAAEILALTFRASGRRAVVSVPGGKLALHPGPAPEIDAKAERCVRQLERRLSGRLAATPGGLDIDGALRQLEQRGRATFLRGDTHWNALGREQYARRVLDAIRPGLAQETGLRRGHVVDRPLDLWRIVGIDRTARDRVLVARRSPDRPPQGVLLMGDSQLEHVFTRPPEPGAEPLVERVLPGAVVCPVNRLDDAICDQALVDARTVVFQIVARNAKLFTETCWRPLSLYAPTLGGRPAGLERLDGMRLGDGHTLGPGQSERVRLRSRTRTSAEPRLMLIPVHEGTVNVVQRPQAGGPAPCASPAGSAGGAVVVPVPAGRRATDLVLDLSTPEGATLGTPREVTLDGTRTLTAAGRRGKDG